MSDPDAAANRFELRWMERRGLLPPPPAPVEPAAPAAAAPATAPSPAPAPAAAGPAISRPQRVIGGVVHDVAQNLANTAVDIMNSMGEFRPGMSDAEQADLQATRPPGRIPQARIPEPDAIRSRGEIEAGFRSLAGYLTTFAATGGFRSGTDLVGRVTSGVAADFASDPEAGTIISLMRDLGIGAEALRPLDARQAAREDRRLQARLMSATEGVVTGAVVEGVVAAIRAVRANPTAREALTRALATGGAATAGAAAAMPGDAR